MLAECARWGLAHGEGWGSTHSPQGKPEEAELARSDGRFWESGGFGGEGGGRGLLRRLLCSRGPALRVLAPAMSGEWQEERGGGQRTGGPGPARWCHRDLGRSWSLGRTRRPCGRWAPCQHPALQGPWGGWGADARPEAEKGRKSEIGVGQAGEASRGPALWASGCLPGLLPGAAWGWWGVPASSSSAVETGQVCLVPPRQQRRGPCSSVTVCPAASVSFQCSGGWLKSQVPCTLESVPLHLEMRSPWRGTRLPSRQPSCRCHLQGRQSLSARGVGWVGSVLTRAGL